MAEFTGDCLHEDFDRIKLKGYSFHLSCYPKAYIYYTIKIYSCQGLFLLFDYDEMDCFFLPIGLAVCLTYSQRKRHTPSLYLVLWEQSKDRVGDVGVMWR